MELKYCLLVAVLVSASLAGPTRQRNSECSSECNGNKKFFYEIGRSYDYKYEAETRTGISGTFSDEAVVKVSALATIQPVTSCEYVLSLSEVSLHNSDKSKVFATEVTRRPLRFAVNNGKVDHICGSEDEPSWVVNFKKGILSSFQNSMKDLEENEVVSETDVSGICETSYSTEFQDKEIVITRNKTPSDCSHKPQIHQKLSSFGYTFDSLVQGLPIMKSTQECKQYISKEIIKKVTCEESHIFQPFEKQGKGAQTTSKTSFELVEVKTSTSPYFGSFSTKKNLLFDYSDIENKETSLEATETILSKLELLTQNGLKKEVPALFSELTHSLKDLTNLQIQSVYQRCGKKLRFFIIDALPLVRTAEAMGAFVDLILKGEIPEKEMDVWFTSLAFIQHPTVEMFSAIEPLLESVNRNKALLGISSLIHNYCNTNENCESKPVFEKVLRVIESRLGVGCRSTTEEEKVDILYTLKALGNIGRFVNSESSLKRCYLEENPMEVRIAAIDAWRRAPCTYDREHLLSAYTDQAQDNEIRISAYLGLMTCPTQEVIDTIKDRLTSESVNQVASFVWTHLTNLQESASPGKQWIRELIGEELLQKKFTSGALKLSRNYESSFYLKEQKFGASVDSNVIFSDKSFLPRSSMVNLTIELFGESINLFEFGGRVEGFEKYIEKFFGPDGYYPEETIATIIKGLRNSNSDENTNLEPYITNDIDEPHGSYYLKLFGNELFYKHFDGIENLFPDKSFTGIFDKIMELARKGSIDFTKSYNLINSEFTYPTITGFPLHLKLNGKATIDLKLDGKFNLESLSSIDIQGKLRPSAAVMFDSSMMVDAFVTKSGMKMVSTLHSSTAFEGKALIKGGKLADLTINVPDEKVEIYDMTNEFFKIENEIETPETVPGLERNKCLPVISPKTGLEICYESFVSENSYSKPYFPLSGPMKQKLFLKKTDTHSSYVLQYSHTPEKTMLLIDMPESQMDNKWSASLTHKNRKYEVDLYSPKGTAYGMFSYVIDMNQFGLDLLFKTNDIIQYKAKFNIAKEIEKTYRQSSVELLIEKPLLGSEIIKVNGKTYYDIKSKSFNAQLSARGRNIPEFTTKFNLNRRPNENSITFDIESTALELSLGGKVANLAVTEGSIDLEGKYRLMNNPSKSLKAKVEYSNVKKSNGRTITCTTNIAELDFKNYIKFDYDENNFDSKIEGKLSQVTWNLENAYSLIKTKSLMESTLKHVCKIPSLKWNVEIRSHILASGEKFVLEKEADLLGIKRETKLIWNYGKQFLYTLKKQYLDQTPRNFNLEVNQLADGSYTLQMSDNLISSSKIRLEGTAHAKVSGKAIDANIKGLFSHDNEVSTSSSDFIWTLTANNSELKSETNLNKDGLNHFLIIHASRSSLSINSNFVKPFSAEAKIENNDEGKRFLITSNLEETVFEASGSLSDKSLQGVLKYKEQEIKMSAKLHDQGVDFEVQLSPEKRLALFINYKLVGEMFLEVSLETPIKDWEKQDMRLSLNLGPVIQGQASITWKNSQHIGLTVELKNDSSYNKINYSGSIRLASTIEDYERIELNIKYVRSSKVINTKIDGKWNSEVIKGNFDAYPVEDGYKLNISLKSPLTEDFSLAFDEKLTSQDISTSLDIVYGTQKSRILFKGNFIDFKNMNANFICFSPYLPEINIVASLQTSSASKTLEIKSKYNGQKILLLMNCENFEKNQDKICKMSLKLVTSSYKIFSGDFTNKITSENGFETDVELSSSFISEQNIKGHIEGRFSSLNSGAVTGYISGPNLSGRINIKHSIDNTKMQSEGNLEINSFKVNVVVGGSVDINKKIGSLHAESESTMPLLNGCKVTIQHSKQDTKRVTEIELNMKEKSYSIYHAIILKDYFNWSNYLKINDLFSIKNEMMTSDTSLKHFTNISWLNKNIDFTIQKNYGNNFNLLASLNTPWTSLVKVDLTHENEASKGISRVKLEYDNGKNILVESEYEFRDTSKYIKISLNNNIWNFAPLEGEITLKNGADKMADLSLQLGNKLKLTYQMIKNVQSTEGIFTINSDIFKPISFTCKYSANAYEKGIYIEYNSSKTYSIDLKLKGNQNTGTLSSIAVIPLLSINPINTSMTYKFSSDFTQIVFENIIKETRYQFDAYLSENKFILKSDCPHGKGELNLKWQTEENKKFISIDFKSPFLYIRDTFFSIKYDFHMSKNIEMELTYGDQRINSLLKLSDQSIEMKATTTFKEWKELSVVIEYKNEELTGTFSKDSKTITFNGKGNFSYVNGEAEMTVTSPFSGYENNLISIKYSYSKSKVQLFFNTQIGKQNLKMDILLNTLENDSKQIILDIQSPWNEVKKVYIEAAIQNSSIKLNGNFNKYSFDSILKATQNSNKDITILFSMTSNIQDWLSCSVESNIHLTNSPYEATLIIKHESQEEKYSASLDLSKNNFDLKVYTPILILRNFEVKGNYNYKKNVLDTSFTFVRNDNTYKISGHIDTTGHIPNINVNVVTPYVRNIEFILNGTLIKEESVNMSLKFGESISKISLFSNLLNSMGTASLGLSLPLFDIQDKYIQLSYDLDSETKHIMLDMKRGDISEKFYIEGRFAQNEFSIAIESPIENYKNIVISGKYQKQNNEIIAYGKVTNEDNVYRFEGKINENENGYEIKTTLPITQFNSVVLNGEITKEKIFFKFVNGREEHEILINYTLKSNKAFVKINTPFENFTYFALGGEYDVDFESVKGNVFLHRNEERLNMGGIAHFSPQKSYFKLNLKSSKNTNYSFNVFYDILSKKKEAGLSYEIGNDIQKYLFETTFDGINYGFVKIYTTRDGYELNGFEYKFKTINFADTEAFITVIKNSKETSFGIISKYTKNEVIAKVLTPFENYQVFGFESNIFPEMKEGKAKISVGSYILGVELSLKSDNFYVHIETPFRALKLLQFISKYDFSKADKFFNVEFAYNDILYKMIGKSNISKENPTLLFNLLTPFEQVKELEAFLKLNINIPKELFDIGLKYNDINYALKFGYQYHGYEGLLLANIITPIEGWKTARIDAKINFNSDEKIIDINFEREGVSKQIFFSGKYLDGEVDFDIQMSLPLEAFGNFKTKGSLSRSKRSVELLMMNDESSGGIIASFHSLQVKASTPFEKAKDITFEITRDSKGGWTVNYKRNENKVFFNFSAEPKKKGFNITIESEVPGWEFLALAGRLDVEEIKAYIEGKVDSGTIHVSGNGLFGDKTGSMTVTSHSSFDKYQEVITKIEYNAKRNIFTFDSQSTSSDYKILLEFKRGLTIDVFVPNDEENTVANGKLTIFKGNLKISSRFPKIRNLVFDYNIELGQKITSKVLFELNGVKKFELDFLRDSTANIGHLEIHGRRGENHSQLHFHREGWNKLEFTFNRNGKEFKVDITGSGDIPQSGTLDWTLSNSFRDVPRTYKGSLEVDRTSSPKKLTLRVELHNGKVYIFHLTYNASLQNMKQGDFTLRTTTPDRSMAAWKDISGNWSYDENNEGKAELHVGPKVYTATGHIGLLEANLVFESNTKDEKFFAQWNIRKSGNERDYFLKLGPENTFVLLKLKGTFDTIYNGDVSGTIQFARFMKNEFTYTSKWSRTSEGLSGGGTFNIGDYSGTHTLTNFKRNPAEKAAKFHWEAKSNIPKFTNVVLHGEYNLRERYADIKLSWDTDEISLKGSLQNLKSPKAENTIKFHIPKYGDSEITLSHDCTNPHEGYFKAIGHLGTAQASLVANWSTNEDFTKIKFHLERDFPIGKATLHVEFNAEDINNAKGNIQYDVGGKFVTIDISRVKTDTSLKDEIVYKSDLTPFKTAHIYINADWSDGFKLDSGIEWNDKAIEAQAEVGPKNAHASITTPFEKFGNININIDYDMKPKSKTVVLKYTRKDQEVNLDLNLKTPSKKSGTLNLSFSTPFEAIQTFSIEASWKKGDFSATYKRNDLTYNVEGKADIKSDLSSFDLTFLLPNGKEIKVAFSYDLESFIKATGTEPNDIIHIDFKIDDAYLDYNVKGFRTPGKIYIEIHEQSTLFTTGKTDAFLKLDCELNLNDREGIFEIKVNDFYFNLKNKFEKRPNGFYARSQIDSSLTALPGLTIGFGRDGDSFIFTTGWGDEREISFTLKGKDHFREGFYGTIDMPRRGIHGLEYSVDYNFPSDDEIHVSVSIQVGEGKEVHVEINYNSEGVKGRLSSPWTGSHSARARRSISNEYFLADIGIDNYGFTFESHKKESSFKKGFKIEGNMFGEKYLLSGFINIDSLSDAEGKLLIETPFKNYEKVGGYFKTKLSNQKYYGKVEIDLFYPLLATIDLNLMDKVKGDALIKMGNYTYEIHCDFIANDYQPLKGKIVVTTPHISFEKIVIDATINSLSINHFQGSFSSEFLGHNYHLNINAKRDYPSYTLDTAFNYDNKFEYKISSEYFLITSPFSLKGNSSVFVNGVKLYESTTEVNFKGIRDMHIAYETVCGEDHFKGSFLLDSDDKKINGEIKGITKNEKKFGITFDIPIHLKQVFVNSYFENDQLHKLRYARTEEVSFKNIIVDLDSPTFIKGLFDMTIFKNSASAIKTRIETPNEKNRFNLNLETVPQTNGTKQLKLISNLVLDCESPITLYVEYDKSFTNREFMLKYKNEELHILHVKHEKNEMTDKFHINVDSFLFPGKTGNLIISLEIENNLKISLESTIMNRTNNIYIKFTKNNLMINCRSPFIPTGMIKLEGSLDYESSRNIFFKFNLSDAYKTLTTEGKIKWDVNNETGLLFEIRTPYEEYRKMKFGIQYTKGDITSVSMFANPFNLEAEAYFGVKSEVFNTGLKIKTGLENYGLTKAEASVPLTKFEPKFSAFVNGMDYELNAKYNKTMYGREISYTSKNIFDLSHLAMSYRAKAPYELNYEYECNKDLTKFGIIFDSSFLSLKEVGRYLVLL